jgi:hypothetical protein
VIEALAGALTGNEVRPMSKLPVTGRWSQTRPGTIALDFPAVPFTAIYDSGGGHVSLVLSRYQAVQTRAILHDLLTISEGSEE